MGARRRLQATRGQASPEWLALILLIALLFLALLFAMRGRLPGASLVESIANRLVCAVRLSDGCGQDSELVAAYGERVAQLVRAHAPGIAYESGMTALPVDFRSCRDTTCGAGAARGTVTRSITGQPVTAFVHVVERGGSTYLQYWLYYPNSATLRGVPIAGSAGYHPDDWEGYQVRIGSSGVDARATSHHGYNYSGGARNWGSDSGIGPLRSATEIAHLRPHGGWGPETHVVSISGGSHAGHVGKSLPTSGRTTPARSISLVPIEALTSSSRATAFAIDPPWRKPVYLDPESSET
ncbi:MAG: hypothetical protein QOG26_1187 [Solirubrobacterales bacterium]|nr:hypothetical protein [Solirubrobacterales bacterium]